MTCHADCAPLARFRDVASERGPVYKDVGGRVDVQRTAAVLSLGDVALERHSRQDDGGFCRADRNRPTRG